MEKCFKVLLSKERLSCHFILNLPVIIFRVTTLKDLWKCITYTNGIKWNNRKKVLNPRESKTGKKKKTPGKTFGEVAQLILNGSEIAVSVNGVKSSNKPFRIMIQLSYIEETHIKCKNTERWKGKYVERYINSKWTIIRLY